MSAKLTALAARIGIRGLVILLLAAAVAVQTVRVDGFKLWPLSIEGWKPKAERLQRVLDAVPAAQEAALAKAQAAKAKAEQDYRDLAERIDQHAQAESERQLDAAERYIAANRVRCTAAGSPVGGTAPAAADRGTGDRDAPGEAAELDDASGPDLPPDWVAVPADDVRICTANTLQAETARAWAIAIEAASGAEAGQ